MLFVIWHAHTHESFSFDNVSKFNISIFYSIPQFREYQNTKNTFSQQVLLFDSVDAEAEGSPDQLKRLQLPKISQ